MPSPIDPLAACPLKTVEYRVQSGSDTGVINTFHLNRFYFTAEKGGYRRTWRLGTEISAGHITVTISV